MIHSSYPMLVVKVYYMSSINMTSFNVFVETFGTTPKMNVIIINLLNVFERIKRCKTTRTVSLHSEPSTASSSICSLLWFGYLLCYRLGTSNFIQRCPSFVYQSNYEFQLIWYCRRYIGIWCDTFEVVA